MSDDPRPPAHVLTAFGVAMAAGADGGGPLGDDAVYRVGDVVFKKVADPAEAAFLAGVLDHLQVPSVRVARPVRSSDGRWVVAGWCAQRFLTGVHEPRFDEIIDTAVALHESLAGVPEPRFLATRTGLYSVADRLVFTETLSSGSDLLGEGHAARVFAELAAGRHAVSGPDQLVHADMSGNVLFAPDEPPAVIDFAPYWRPAAYAAAVIAVDALTWGGADLDLLDRWRSLPDWPELVRRALMFRLAVSLLHPGTTPSWMVEMLSAVDRARPFLA